MFVISSRTHPCAIRNHAAMQKVEQKCFDFEVKIIFISSVDRARSTIFIDDKDDNMSFKLVS